LLHLPTQTETYDNETDKLSHNEMLIVKIFEFMNPDNYFQSTMGSTSS